MSDMVFAPASPKQEMFLNSDATITLAGGAAGCFDADTEFLTPQGWKRIADFSDDLVAQYCPTTDTISFVTPKEYIKLPQEYLTKISARGLDMCLSDEHRVLYWSEKNQDTPYKVIPFSEVKSRHLSSKRKGWTGCIKTTFKLSGTGTGLTEGDIRLEVAVQADGRIVKEGKNNYTQMRFAKKRKYDRLIQMCKKYNLPYKDNGSKPSERYASGLEYEVIVWPKIGTKIFEGFWWNITQTEAEIIADEVGFWDGSFVFNEKSETTRYFTKHKQNADFMQFVFHACGYNTSYVVDKRDGSFTINANGTGNGFRSFVGKETKAELEAYKTLDGYKYCFSVPTGFLLVRRNNKVYLSGNSGKTFTALLIALKFMQHPRATGVIFRRTSKMLTAPGSIWREAVSMYSTIYPKGLRIRTKELEIIFPNGAVLKFSHMQHASNALDHKGAQYSLVIFDEATDFDEEMIVYLLSRMRNAYVDYNPQMFLMTNPDYNSFLRSWIEGFYLDQKGIPIPDQTGYKRYFYRQGNTMLWYNSLEEAQEVHGHGPEAGLSSFTFIGANCRDNPPLLKAQPDYISRLMSLPRVERERLLDGSWYARQESSGLFKREWCEMVDFPNYLTKHKVRAWDLAFTQPSEINPNPDFTRGVLISKDHNLMYTVEDVKSMQDRVHKVEQLIFETAKSDGADVVISIPQDPNAAAAAYAKGLQLKLGNMGYICRLSKPVKSKVTRFAPFSSVAQAGHVKIVTGDWNKEFFEELENFGTENKNLHDDMVDCCSDCMSLLNKEHILPTFTLPDLTRTQTVSFSFGAPNNSFNIPTLNFGV